MDQDVINLAKSIRKNESGGNTGAVGDGGTSTGAFQIQEPTWKSYAKEILGDENAQRTPDNEKAVVYGKLKKWKDSGKNPAQIASMWNAGEGEPDAYTGQFSNGSPSRGRNQRLGVDYDVPAYVKKVTDDYHVFKGQGGGIVQPVQVQDVNQNERQQMIDKGEPVSVNPEKAKPSFFGGIVRGAAKLPARLGLSLAAIADSLSGAGSAITGDQAGVDQAQQSYDNLTKEGANSEYLGNLFPIGFGKTKSGENFAPDQKPLRSFVDAAGAGAEAASYIVGGEGAVPIVKGLTKTPLLQLAKQGLKTGAVSGAIGGGGMGAQEASEADTAGEGAMDILKGAGTGALVGGGTGAVLSPAAGAAGRLVQRGGQVAGDLTAPTEKAGQTAIQKIEDRVYKALGLTQEQIDRQGRKVVDASGKEVPRPSAVETLLRNDALEPSLDSQNKLYSKNKEYSEAASKWAQQEQAEFNFDQMIDEMKGKVDDYTTSASEAEKIFKHIDEEVAALERQGKIPGREEGGADRLVKADVLERLRKTANDWAYNQKKTRNNPELEGAGKLLGNNVRDFVEKFGTFPEYRKFNQEWGDLIQAQNFLREMIEGGNGGANKGIFGRKGLSGLLGIKKTGITGTILDSLGIDALVDYATNPQTASYFDRKIVEASSKGKPTGTALDSLVKSLDDYVTKKKANPEMQPIKGRLRERAAKATEETGSMGGQKVRVITEPNGRKRIVLE